jgi:hypothetical protein
MEKNEKKANISFTSNRGFTMCKEVWLHAYECAIEDLCEEHDINEENARILLENILNENSSYLDGYITYED